MPGEVVDPGDLEPHEVRGVVRHSLRVGLREANYELGLEFEGGHGAYYRGSGFQARRPRAGCARSRADRGRGCGMRKRGAARRTSGERPDGRRAAAPGELTDGDARAAHCEATAEAGEEIATEARGATAAKARSYAARGGSLSLSRTPHRREARQRLARL